MSSLSRYIEMNWQLQEAKNKFSKVVRDAQQHGPQVITVHGKNAAVVLSADEYERLLRKKYKSLYEFMRASPWSEIDLDLERSQETAREIEL